MNKDHMNQSWKSSDESQKGKTQQGRQSPGLKDSKGRSSSMPRNPSSK